MQKSNTTPTELGTADIRKLLIDYSGPAIAAMMASALYNVIDRIFIGQGVSEYAISGLAVTMPVMNLSAAFGAMIGAGGATLTSIKMGQQDYESTKKVLGNVTLMNIVLGIIFMVLGLVYIDEILYFFGASDNTISYARDFMQVILAGNVITHLYLGLNSVMRSSGNPRKAMRITIMTVVINLVLAPLFIFLFNWGIRGAALSTIFAQLVALLVVIHHFRNPNAFLQFKRSAMKFDLRICKSILSIGMAPFVLNACACLVVIIINKALYDHGGDLAIGAYGIVNSILMIFMMLVMGVNQGMQPIAGYNFGARLYSRVRKVLKLTIVFATGITCLAFLIAQVAPGLLARMFTTSDQLIELTVLGLRVCCLAMPIVGFQMVTSNFFQSVGKAQMAVILSASRQLLLLIPLLLILPQYFGVVGVFASMPLADSLAAIIAFILLRREMKSFSKLEDQPIQ
jgi:putative MATE family efflux protein